MMDEINLIELVLSDYKEAFDNMPNNFLDARNYIIEKEMDCGICSYADSIYGEDVLYKSDIVDSKIPHRQAYWYTPPDRCDTLEDIRYSIHYRIRVMEEILKENRIKIK